MLDEFANTLQRFAGILHQVFVVNLEVIAAHRLTVAPALADDPAPENRGDQETAAAVPWQRTNPSDAMQRSGDVAAVADDVDHERVGNQFLNQRKIEQMERRGLGPALRALFLGDGLHHNAQEVAGIAAIPHHAGLDVFGGESGALKQFAGVVGVQQLAAIAATREGAEAQAQQVKGVALGVIDGEASGGKQRVIKEFCSRASAAEDKYGRRGARGRLPGYCRRRCRMSFGVAFDLGSDFVDHAGIHDHTYPTSEAIRP